MHEAKAPRVTPREEILEPLRRVLRWLLSLRDGEGRILCPEHRIEHTGKSAGVCVIAAQLARLDPSGEGDAYFEAATQQARRLVANLVREGISPCHTFRPGRHDPYNCSNSVIDGGACSDALVEVVTIFGDRLGEQERESFQAAAILHARTYLRYAVLDKGIPAQRAWGLTGLAGAYSLERDDEFEAAAVEAFGVLEGIQHRDGSYPYHPVEWGAAHPGAADASAFYQSRVTAFQIFALERLGRDPKTSIFAPALKRGLDFLLALQGIDGRKCGLVEAKPWYWGATYEVASHPFDVYALARGYHHFGGAEAALGAQRSFRAWVEHLGPEGKPASHHPGHGRRRSYQCPVFWAGHASWLARAAEDLEACMAVEAPKRGPGAGIELRVTHFPSVDLVRLEDDRVQAWIRGARPPFNGHHGSPHGAGLLRVLRKEDGQDLIARCRLGGRQEGEWHGKLGLPSPGRGWRAGRHELRFSTWMARNAWRGGRRLEALKTPARILRECVLAFGAPRVGSPFFREPVLRVSGDGVRIEGAIARRDGTPIPGTRIERDFRIEGEGLRVSERLLERGPLRGLEYRTPAEAQEVVRGEDSESYRLG